jgi:peptidoglycan/LPS O-acetylase OafA/YrhL
MTAQTTDKHRPIVKNIHFEHLDGLRFLCFLSVFLYHSFHTESTAIQGAPLYRFVDEHIFGNGNMGVNFFFVLSGFLITYLLIAEKQLNHQIDVPRFWLRRILRIWPLYYCCVLFGFYAFPMLKTLLGQTPNETATVGYYLAFLSNFDLIAQGLPDASILGVLWSVAIEEQFYLLWPLVLYVLPVRHYSWVFVGIILISWAYRACNDIAMLHEYSTFSCMGDMAVGALGAWAIGQYVAIRRFFEQLPRCAIISLYALLVFIFLFRDEVLYSHYILRIFERTLVALVALGVILEQNYALRSPFKLGHWTWISHWGTISYGLYCLHFIGILIVLQLTKLLHLNTQLWQVLCLETILALILTIGISELSYRLLERPFLRLKERFAYFSRQ